ncbi:hypothetical protein [Actinomadura algeriensis]|uniref:Monooxygenase n=1 Tax=Actinomadura algeriensis TaxID=1679523 RepID=A0ABR9JWS4_9ACTN|nr:hypothetical protein [Actinomadura algeriensis]MBE1535024.1 hypothetical protein [Actinomadura algeriensis]
MRTRWLAGPAPASGPVLVSVTGFTCARARDLPGVFRAGTTLRRSWPELPGAVGLWLWSVPLERRCGSVSVWTDGAALRGFVRLPAHVAIMRRYRGRGEIRTASWETDAFDPAATWARAGRFLAQAGVPSQTEPR